MELQLGNNGGVSGDEHEAFNSGNKGKTIAILVNRFCSLKSIIKLSLNLSIMNYIIYSSCYNSLNTT
jgi:hypothetical protein